MLDFWPDFAPPPRVQLRLDFPPPPLPQFRPARPRPLHVAAGLCIPRRAPRPSVPDRRPLEPLRPRGHPGPGGTAPTVNWVKKRRRMGIEGSNLVRHNMNGSSARSMAPAPTAVDRPAVGPLRGRAGISNRHAEPLNVFFFF